jgi:hypothetical protein
VLVAPPPSLDRPAGEDDWDEAPDIPRPASARAPLLITPEAAARDPETDGEKDPLVPDPDTVPEVLDACAEPAP